jgi:hypothetical protein
MRATKRTVLLFLAAATSLALAQPVIVVNNSTGSDTAASGAPSSFGPFSAVATCHTNGAASTTIQWAANPLTGVPTDGSAVIWLATAAGRRWSRITGRAAGTVTVADSFNIAAGTPVDCAVGGKRSSLTASRLFLDLKDTEAGFNQGWTLRIESTGANYTINAAQSTTDNLGSCLVEGDPAGARPILEGTVDGVMLDLDSCDIRHLSFINSAVAKTASVAIDAQANDAAILSDLVVGGGTTAASFFRGIIMPIAGTLYNSEVRFNGTGVRYGCGSTVAANPCKILWNYIHENATGLNDAGALGNNAFVFRNLIVNNSGDGVLVQSSSQSVSYFVENVVDGNGGDAFDMTANPGAEGHGFIGNQISNNGLFGMTCTSGQRGCGVREDNGIVAFNNFFNNTSGARNNYVAGDSETTIDPGYVDRTAKNYCTIVPATPDGGPPGASLKYAGSQTGSVIRRGICQPVGGGGANLGI